MRFAPLLILAAALPALADTRFQIRRMTRDDVPLGKGQCDVRLQVDNEVEVQLRGDMLTIRTLAGQDARDDGSECNAPLPNRDVQGFNYEVRESRNDIRLLAGPTRRNDFAAVVRIRDSSGGFGRYHFRVTWAMTGSDYRSGGGPAPRGPAGFVWNNALTYRGNGRGEASYNDGGQQRLRDVSIEIDRGGKLVASFRADRGRPLSFNGNVMSREEGRWKADIVSEDRRLRGPMWFSVDDRGNITAVTIEATDGRDRMRLNWDRR